MKLRSKRTYPWTDRISGQSVTFRLMAPEDRDAVLRFTKGLDTSDTLYLRSDITKPEVVDEWIANIQSMRTLTVLALDEDGRILGYGSLHRNPQLWTRHLGEIRLFVHGKLRGIGLGARLASELFQLAKDQNLMRLVVNIPRDQPHVRQMLEKLGFHAEALLTDWLMDAHGHTHDLLIMSHFVEEI